MALDKNFGSVWGSGPIISLTSKSVCSICNNGILSDELEQSLDTLEYFINGRKLEVSDTHLRVLIRYFERLAILLDVESSNHDLLCNSKSEQEIIKDYGASNSFPPCVPREDRREYVRGSGLKTVKLWFGYHSGYIGVDPILKLILLNDGKDYHSKYFSGVLGKLAFVVDYSGRFNFEEYNYVSTKTLSLENKFLWPFEDEISYDSYYATCAQSPDIKQMRKLFSNRYWRRRIISSMRRGEKNLELPLSDEMIKVGQSK